MKRLPLPLLAMMVMLAMLSFETTADTKIRSELENLAQLRTGDILHEHTHLGEPGAGIRAEILIRAPVEDFWAALKGCKKALVFVDGLEQCDVLEQTDEYDLVHQVVDRGFWVPVQNFTYKSVRQAYTRIDFNKVKGSMKTIKGSWDFIAVDEGVVAIYNMHVQTGLPIPRFLVRRSIRKTIPTMLACIRGLVDGSGSPEKTREDLEHCPGDTESL